MSRILLVSVFALLMFLARKANADETTGRIPPVPSPVVKPVDPLILDAAEPVGANQELGRDAAGLPAVPAAANADGTLSAPDGEGHVAAATQTKLPATTDVEAIQERYPNRAVKIEREVIRDTNDNYVNHGGWRMWDRRGEMIAKGRYLGGKRHGEWTAWFVQGEVDLLKDAPFKKFEPPFTSVAEFDGGQLNGKWIISDSKQRVIAEWHYVGGTRHGTWKYWYVTGVKMRTVEYEHGLIHGSLQEWDADGNILREDRFVQGRRVGTRTEHFTNQQKKSEGGILFAQVLADGYDDWWNMKLASFIRRGEDQKHGVWQEWYPNGQVRLQGEYELEQPKPNSTWSWWYDNGQKAVEGTFAAGQKNGRWIWWHENGQKRVEGHFQNGQPSRNWIWWEEDGIVAKRADFSAPAADAAADVTREQEQSPVGLESAEVGTEGPAVRVALPQSDAKLQ